MDFLSSARDVSSQYSDILCLISSLVNCSVRPRQIFSESESHKHMIRIAIGRLQSGDCNRASAAADSSFSYIQALPHQVLFGHFTCTRCDSILLKNVHPSCSLPQWSVIKEFHVIYFRVHFLFFRSIKWIVVFRFQHTPAETITYSCTVMV
jgi:hypothetical protein